MPTDPRELSYVDALSEAVAQAMEADPRVFLFGLDVDDHKAINGSTAGLLERFGPERVFGTPLSEDAMTGVAIGAAMAGMRPIHVHIRMDFLMLCMNQLVNVAAKAHAMYGGQVRVPMVVRSIIGKSWGQGAQHSQGLHSMLAHVPGIRVVAPSNAYDAKGCMLAAIAHDNPVLMVEHRLLYGTRCEVPEASYEVAMGKARVCAAGANVTLVGISNMVNECLVAREMLAEVGVAAEVLDPVWLSPLDLDSIAASAARTGALLVVDSAWTFCGMSAEILAGVAERAGAEAAPRMARMGFAPTVCPPSPPLEKVFYPDARGIAERAFRLARPQDAPWTPPETGSSDTNRVAFQGPF